MNDSHFGGLLNNDKCIHNNDQKPPEKRFLWGMGIERRGKVKLHFNIQGSELWTRLLGIGKGKI
jgi:hypothetical protein